MERLLHEMDCETAGLGSRVVGEEEADGYLLAVPAWRKGFHEGVEKLIREFHFIEFDDAFAFTLKVVELSNQQNHHPSILTEWGKVTVYWWTHKINGLHLNDFIMAAKTDMIARVSMTV